MNMYLEHFNLKEFPFLPSPDSRYLYLSNQVNEALQKCLYVIDNRIGPLYVYGSYGTGKTTLAHRLRDQLQQMSDRYNVAYFIVPPQLKLNALLRNAMLKEFDIPPARSYAGNLEHLATWLVEQHKQEVKPVLILDEAEYLTPSHLKLLHFLLNYETSREKLLQLVLFGQPELANRIDRLPELKSRMYPAALTALTRKDTAEMLAFRWFVAGGKQLPFSEHQIDDIFRLTLGLPREIVKLCDLALVRAYSSKRKTITDEDILTAAQELGAAAQ